MTNRGICATPYLKEQYKEHGPCAAMLRVYGVDTGNVRVRLNGRTYRLVCRHGVALGTEQPDPGVFAMLFNYCLAHPGTHGEIIK